MIIIRLLSIALLLSIFGCNGQNENTLVPSPKKVHEIDKIRLQDLNGHALALEKYKGKTIFINFWATWCKSCIEEMPSIEKAQNMLRDKGVVFLLASAESTDQIEAFRMEHDYKLNFSRIENSEELNIQALPTTFIFTPDGKLFFSEMGSRKWDDKKTLISFYKIQNKMPKLLTILLLMILFVSCKNPSVKTSNEMNNLKSIASPTGSFSAEPYLFTNKNGVVYLSWIEKGKEKSWMKFSRLNNGKWSAPTVITAGNNWFVNWADYPMLASDEGDNLIAHVLEKSGKSTYAYDVKLITSNDKGNSWSDTKILHDDGKKAEHGFVSIIPYNENYFISWLDGRNTAAAGETGHPEGHKGQMTIRAAVVSKQGNKSSEWELDGRVCDCCQTSAAITANGPIVVYRNRSDEEIRDISIVRLVNDKWTAPKILFADNWKIAGCPVNGPRADAQGNNMAVAWFSSTENKGQVKIIFSQDGGANFKPPTRIDEGKGIGRVDVIMLDEKSAMVSWMEGSAIKAARVFNDGRKEPSITIASSSESRSSGFPQMTKSGNNIIFAWSDDKDKTIKIASLAL